MSYRRLSGASQVLAIAAFDAKRSGMGGRSGLTGRHREILQRTHRLGSRPASRVAAAIQDTLIPAGTNVNKRDEARYADKADLCAVDNVQFGQPIVPPGSPIAGDQSATELLEHYWASLLRDGAFTDYSSSALAGSAAAELSSLRAYLGPRNSRGQVTTDLLFRGVFPGETLGPYVSQFLITPTSLGASPLDQRILSYLPQIDYMTNFADWPTVQNGNATGLENQIDPLTRYPHVGRDLACVHPCGCALSGIFRSLAGTFQHWRTHESWQSLQRITV